MKYLYRESDGAHWLHVNVNVLSLNHAYTYVHSASFIIIDSRSYCRSGTHAALNHMTEVPFHSFIHSFIVHKTDR